MDLVEAKEKVPAPSRHPWELARLRVVKKLIAEKIKLPQDGTVLDIGCGDTFVVESIASDYPSSTFLAVDTAFTDEMIADFKLRIKKNNISLFKSLPDIGSVLSKPVSLVLLMDVIEHIEDDIGFLKNVLNQHYINANTCFLITAPSYQSLFCSHDHFLGHYRRYTNKLLRWHLHESGLDVLSMGYFFFSLLPIRVLQVLKEKISVNSAVKNSTGLTTWNGSRVISSVLKNLLWLDANVSLSLEKINLKMPGLSNYALCRRSA